MLNSTFDRGREPILPRISITDEIDLAAPSRQASASLMVETSEAGFIDLTHTVADWVRRHGFGDGLVVVFIRHTSASLTVQENADPDVRADLLDAFDRIAPQDAGWRHQEEGPDDMPGHVKAALTGASVSVPVRSGRLWLGTWQAIYLIEHRSGRISRGVEIHFIGS